MEQGNIAVYPGTFDPLTNGHLSIIRRGCEIFDTVVVAVAHETYKKSLFTHAERLDMIREVFDGVSKVVVEGFTGLLVDYVEQRGAKVILRGLRAVADFEYEFQLALMNRKLKRDVQPLFLMTDYRWLYVSSTIVKAAGSLGGNIRSMVPDVICHRLYERWGIPCPPESSEELVEPDDLYELQSMSANGESHD